MREAHSVQSLDESYGHDRPTSRILLAGRPLLGEEGLSPAASGLVAQPPLQGSIQGTNRLIAMTYPKSLTPRLSQG